MVTRVCLFNSCRVSVFYRLVLLEERIWFPRTVKGGGSIRLYCGRQLREALTSEQFMIVLESLQST